MHGRRPTARTYRPEVSLELIRLLACAGPVAPSPGRRSAIAYVAAYLDGAGACADLVGACLAGAPGAEAGLRARLGLGPAVGGPVGDGAGPAALARIVAERAGGTGPGGPAR